MPPEEEGGEMTHRIRAVVLLLAVILLAASPATRAGSAEGSLSHFSIRILTKNWFDLGLGYKYESAWPRLQQARGAALATVGERDVESYDWARQTLTLTPTASERLRAELAAAMPSRPADPSRAGDALPGELYLKGFVVEVDDQPIYGGIFLQAISQMAIDYPVIRAEQDAVTRVVLHIAPLQAWATFGDATATTEHGVGQVRHALGSAWADSLKDPKFKALVDGFWARIEDPGIRDIFARAGTLRDHP